ncbi:MAG: acetylornithine deacetylase/succinyl-diaminopimelate desuccinylase-like protein [Myxococcota bacterium]|jgi:acetylornithine deacetylase/succinyl-diaminopimelate desuccinylase-like protein
MNIAIIAIDDALAKHALDLCQRLLQIDTTNPPGNEKVAALMLAEEFTAMGLEPVVLDSAPGRANVVARLKGNGKKPPLLLTAHLDVVEADESQWDHPPFSGVIADGCLWGRGAIDMKNMAAMSVALMAKLVREKTVLDRDIIFAGVADEEAGCKFGSLWLVENHPELVQCEYALGEGGGFNIHIGGKSFFTVQVAEKGVCWVRARVKGEPGHGSMPRPDSAVIKLAEGIARLGKKGLSSHPTQVMKDFVNEIAKSQPAIARPLMKLLFRPEIAPAVLSRLPNQSVARALLAMLQNTASPTVLRAGNKTNVIPGFAEAEIDGRMLPGQTQEDFLSELQDVLGPEFELEVIHSLPPVETLPRESPLLDTIISVMKEVEPTAPVVPYLLPGFTDAKAFTQLGARWYGFAPVKMPPEIRFADLFHGHNERIPVEGLRWGTQVLYDIVTRFCGDGDA